MYGQPILDSLPCFPGIRLPQLPSPTVAHRLQPPNENKEKYMDAMNRETDREGLAAETGMVADFGVAQPGSPADEMGTSVSAPSGGVGALDPGGDADEAGDTQVHDRGIVDEQTMPLGDALKPRLTHDIDPDKSNVAGPTSMGEGNNR